MRKTWDCEVGRKHHKSDYAAENRVYRGREKQNREENTRNEDGKKKKEGFKKSCLHMNKPIAPTGVEAFYWWERGAQYRVRRRWMVVNDVRRCRCCRVLFVTVALSGHRSALTAKTSSNGHLRWVHKGEQISRRKHPLADADPLRKWWGQ